MDTAAAFRMGEMNRGKPLRVFDWIEAAKLIASTRPQEASAGLSGDWEWTGGAIYRDGAPVPQDETYTFLASTWAIPELSLDYDMRDCWIWQADSPGWDASTYWPDEALKILRGE
jgi:hypothetical protein